ncbi:mercury transporter [Desulfitobacterium chlororespirans]|uniref:Mercury transporter n=1 Tax=Desulfitobacterium chlororespirans DSM 11544 TaxID=1121395 RepID=A0A1M7UYB9_9FIRM|nr:mercury transporter [Desulfitobacterium chlororespirans]SHN87932.1 hypothetical protein SAMN02745215_05036 [Desulfitobacterium chlororespirans DSM 11544]
MEIDDLTVAVIVLIRAGVIMRIAFCFFRMMGNEEDGPMYRKRAINAAIFYIIAESVWQLRDIVFYYFK